MNWSDSHNGLFHCPFNKAYHFMPEISGILNEFCGLDLNYEPSDYVLDVKVHMLMPGQYPCIPNWHLDMVPRNEDGAQDLSKVNEQEKMYLWVSGHPLTEFRWGLVKPETWTEFTQLDLHRGTVSNKHTWRCFMRAAPKTILKPAPISKCVRRHSQVYLDAKNFKW